MNPEEEQRMYYVIHCIDHAYAAATRHKRMSDHKAYLARADLPVRILVSGPLVRDGSEEPIGSFFLVEATDRDAVNRFRDGDPFKRAGIWEQEDVDAFLKRQDVR
jgi:uncharacterized protein YciI